MHSPIEDVHAMYAKKSVQILPGNPEWENKVWILDACVDFISGNPFENKGQDYILSKKVYKSNLL